jgi:hypothetical protein
VGDRQRRGVLHTGSFVGLLGPESEEPSTMNHWQEELETSLNATADQDLGTVVSVLDGKGMFQEAAAVELCGLRYDLVPDNWTPQIVKGVLEVDPLLLGSITAEIVEEVSGILAGMLRDVVTWSGVDVIPRQVPVNWREARAAAWLSDIGPNNQATYRTLTDAAPTRDRLRFGSGEEARVYDALRRVQARRPPEQTLGIMPGAGFRALNRTFWPDFVVTHRGRAAAIEVDGPHHSTRAAADQSRDRQLEDAGLLFVERVVVEDTTDLRELDLFVERFLARLLTR